MTGTWLSSVDGIDVGDLATQGPGHQQQRHQTIAPQIPLVSAAEWCLLFTSNVHVGSFLVQVAS